MKFEKEIIIRDEETEKDLETFYEKVGYYSKNDKYNFEVRLEEGTDKSMTFDLRSIDFNLEHNTSELLNRALSHKAQIEYFRLLRIENLILGHKSAFVIITRTEDMLVDYPEDITEEQKISYINKDVLLKDKAVVTEIPYPNDKPYKLTISVYPLFNRFVYLNDPEFFEKYKLLFEYY